MERLLQHASMGPPCNWHALHTHTDAPWLHPPPALGLTSGGVGGLRKTRQSGRRDGGLNVLRGGGDMQEWLPPAFKRLPLMTRWLIAFQTMVFLLGHLAPDHPYFGAGGGAFQSLGLSPVLLLQPFQQPRRKGDELAVRILQSYRALTHVLVHASLPHLIFNMYSFSGVGERLERLVGSVGLLQLVVVLALTKSVILVSCEAILLFYTRQSRLLSGPLVGFSGVIFGLFTIDSLLADANAQVSIFGMPVPARVFPVVLLFIQWIMFPFASFWGHAAGIVAGSFYSAGLLRWAKFPAVIVKDLGNLLQKHDGHMRGPRQGMDIVVTRVFGDLWRSFRR